MIKAVIFDMDGLMIDTESVHMRAWDIIGLEMRGEKLSWLLPRCLGTPPPVESKIVWEALGEDFDYFEFNRRVLALTEEILEEEGVPLKKGIKELLEHLKKKGVKIAVASSSFRKCAEEHLSAAGLLSYFDAGVFGDEVKSGKPDPEIFLKAAEALGVQPSEAIVLEDSHNGIKGAYGGGFMPIMVPDIVGPNEEMKNKTLAICEDLLKVKALIKNRIKFRYLKSAFDKRKAISQ